ncbi:hypothetical protein E4U43_006417, partial [Claviceps pusilla]
MALDGAAAGCALEFELNALLGRFRVAVASGTGQWRMQMDVAETSRARVDDVDHP